MRLPRPPRLLDRPGRLGRRAPPDSLARLRHRLEQDPLPNREQDHRAPPRLQPQVRRRFRRPLHLLSRVGLPSDVCPRCREPVVGRLK
ncbi:MAG: hypothetical protein AABZ16_15125, partial [candidate division NC10 bacterium]